MRRYALRPLKGLVVIDEIQRRPELYPLLRVLADRRPLPARFLILGSASPDLLRQSSESLAGRIETVTLDGFRLADLDTGAQARHWLRGGFPPSFTDRSETDSFAWRTRFLRTFCATHAGAELDLLLFKRGKRIGVEYKRTDAPTLTPSMRIALEDLRLNELLVVYPGERRYPLGENAQAVPLAEVAAAKREATIRNRPVGHCHGG